MNIFRKEPLPQVTSVNLPKEVYEQPSYSDMVQAIEKELA